MKFCRGARPQSVVPGVSVQVWPTVESTVVEPLSMQTVMFDTPMASTDSQAVDEIVAASMAVAKQPGVIVDITGPKGAYTKAYGSTGIRPLTVSDYVRIGSLTKTFVALAAWQQIDKGALSLDDKLSKYVSGVPLGDTITIQHVMSMRSGVFDYTQATITSLIFLLWPTFPWYSEDMALSAIRAMPSQFTPGSQQVYSNSNAILMGAVLEKITGKNIATILAEDVFVPLGLNETYWPTTPSIPEPAASTTKIHPALTGAAGCLISTVGDLTKFAKILRDGLLLTTESHNTWTRIFWGPNLLGTMGVQPPTSVGYGHFLMRYGTWIGHGGSIFGFTASCLLDTVTGATIVVAENKQTQDAQSFYTIARNIANQIYPGSMVEQTYPMLS